MSYRNRYTNYGDNPFAQLQPTPYISQKQDFPFDDYLRGLQFTEQRRQEGLAQQDAITMALGNITATGINANKVLEEEKAAITGELSSLGEGKYGFADPNIRDKVRKLATNFASNDKLKHIVEYEQAYKADLVERNKLGTAAPLLQLRPDENDAFTTDEEGNLVKNQFNRNWIARPDKEKVLNSIADKFDNVITSTNLDDLNAGNSNKPYVLSKITKETGITFSPEEYQAALNEWKGTPAYQAFKENYENVTGFEGFDSADAKLESELKDAIIANAKTEESQRIIANALYNKGGEETPNTPAVAIREEAVSSKILPAQETNESLSRTPLISKGTEPTDVNQAVKRSYTDAFVTQPKVQEGIEEASNLIKKIDFNEINKVLQTNLGNTVSDSPNVWTKFWNGFKKVLAAQGEKESRAYKIKTGTYDPITAAKEKENFKEEIEQYNENLKDKEITIDEAINLMVQDGNFDLAENLVSTLIENISSKTPKSDAFITNNEDENPVSRLESNKLTNPLYETLSKLKEIKESHELIREGIETKLNSDFASKKVIGFDQLVKDDKARESLINYYTDVLDPKELTVFNPETGEQEEIKSLNDIVGFKRLGNNIYLEGKVTFPAGKNANAYGDNANRTIKVNDVIGASNVEGFMARLPNYKAAIKWKNVTIPGGEYIEKNGKLEKLPDGYEIKRLIMPDNQGRDVMAAQLYKDGKLQNIETFDDNGIPLGEANTIPFYDAFLFLNTIYSDE